ncbi:MAG: hypothetical protein ACLRVQ_04280 [Lachnospiraceae bacterium]
MKEKGRVLVGLILMCTVLAGCGDKETKNKEEIKKPVSVAEGEVSVQGERKEEYPTVTEISEFTPVKESQEFNFNTDCQYYMMSHYLQAESEDSIYFVSSVGNILKVFDKTTKSVSIMCNKPECPHEKYDYECNAYFARISNIFYYNGSLYVLMAESREGEGDVFLIDLNMYRVSADGSERTFITSLYTIVGYDGAFASTTIFRVNCIQHRGYLYYIYDTGVKYEGESFYNYGSNCLRRMNLETLKEDEKCLAYMPIGSDYQQVSLMAKGSYVYYVKGDSEGFGEVYRFNTESLESEKIDIGTIAFEDLGILGSEILYKKDWQSYDIYRYNPDTGEEELFANLESSQYANCYNFYVDENYVYVNCKDNQDDKFNFEVLNYSGEMVYTIELDVHVSQGILCISSDYILYGAESDDENEIYYLDKGKIETGDAEYIKIE